MDNDLKDRYVLQLPWSISVTLIAIALGYIFNFDTGQFILGILIGTIVWPAIFWYLMDKDRE